MIQPPARFVKSRPNVIPEKMKFKRKDFSSCGAHFDQASVIAADEPLCEIPSAIRKATPKVKLSLIEKGKTRFIKAPINEDQKSSFLKPNLNPIQPPTIPRKLVFQKYFFVSCGGGSRTATRICQNGDSCEGRSDRNQTCGENACPTWSSWTAFGECSVTCGLGEKVRGRTCKNGDDCPGSKIETAYCELAKCGPVYSEWTAWSKLGLKSRSRKCKSGNCKSNVLDETQQCTETVCPRWDEWEAWSICTATCGGGMHYRQRQCIGGGCQGIPMAYEPCNQDACDAGCSGPRDVLFVAHYTTYMGSTFGDISAFFENIISTINVEPSDSSIRFAFSFFNHAYIEFFASSSSWLH
ncbi:unnamed protein product [Oikopleura dioica]|uniref:Uncharacterized protein n=1 Tax=Oikopleura dioica TaxID=34765 RepID=E4Z5W5_OIKDI|nr:unnamed protein product [Oikopleura dioica]